MRWATRVGGLFGIGLFIHWTFWLLIVWLSAASWLQGSTFGETLWGVALVLAIFACVVLHELGHALAARRFGVRTRDITLLPIGGVARLERIPEQPMQELAIALAGPAVNLVIAVALFAIIWVTQGVAAIGLWEWFGGDFLAKLMLANAFLVAFNLLPAFPMDGGRVLRALLATRMEHVRATQIAGAVGQAMGILFVAAGFFVNWFLMFIGLFVYLGAQQESRFAQVKSLLRSVPVRDAMITRFRLLDANSPIGSAIAELLAGDQQHFPVVANGRVTGMMSVGDIIAALSAGSSDARIRDVPCAESLVADESDMLEATFERMQEADCRAAPVVRDGRLVGMITMDNVDEWLTIRSALQGSHPSRRFVAESP